MPTMSTRGLTSPTGRRGSGGMFPPSPSHRQASGTFSTTTGKPEMDHPAPFLKQQSEGTLRLASLRKRLEELEARKQAFTMKEETDVKALKTVIQGRFQELRECLDERITEITVAAKMTDLAGSMEDWNLGLPSSGRDAALVLASLEKGAPLTDTSILTLKREKSFLERQRLAAKVMANVAQTHKKLLNLTYSWLRTFLPHCLSKINRVSFGLLTEEDCEAVLKEDPMVPRSRLKLAVPFVGKDVPSSSSEFAHPDIIIGLTVLAYRYSGLRRNDFDDVVDEMTANFTNEIGPARDRPSSRRHEFWVLESGGKLRGLKNNNTDGVKKMVSRTSTTGSGNNENQQPAATRNNNNNTGFTALEIPDTAPNDVDADSREVVQLKFLSKSNAEQMGKLYELWRLEPHTIHHYLNRFIFPSYMRHQRSKISASGQAVGGDMLFGRRVGFSGTPSDLLPKELGKCSYETGDDGKMLSTVLDPAVSSYEHLPSDWTVEGLLEQIATSEFPRYYALIDTGALVTGYSNYQVARELLDRGLEWCHGVVFLDENDRQNVLVRDTGRVVPADQCGVPLEKRFAFYDQIHTTGMDIQHVVNATAVITLGKDMVFRDFVQGAYRMRGIGMGQQVRCFVIPEVKNLIERELRAAGDIKRVLGDTVVAATTTTTEAQDSTMTQIVAWLVINSMRSEMTQWSMLCLQNVTNVYRKNAFKHVLQMGLEESTASESTFMAQRLQNSNGTANSDRDRQLEALSVFDEPIDFTLDSSVPDPVPFVEKLQEALRANDKYITSNEERAVASEVLDEVTRYSVTDGRTMERLDSEQEREQEQEQEKEVRSKREQEIEVEKFVDREYTRSDEAQKSWHVTQLLFPPKPTEDEGGHPFFPMKEFKLRYGEVLRFPEFLACSRNYFNPAWSGLRRVKNVIMALEYCPDLSTVSPRTPEETLKDSVLESRKAMEALAKAFLLLATSSSSSGGNSENMQINSKPEDASLNAVQLAAAIRAATDTNVEIEHVEALLKEFANPQTGHVHLDGLQKILTAGRIRVVENGRHFVAVSLAEAETLRRIIHMQQENASLLKGSTGSNEALVRNLEVALRYIPMQTLGAGVHGAQNTTPTAQQHVNDASFGLIFDASRGWRDGTTAKTSVSQYQLLAAHSCLRFLDCAQHYSERALNVLVRCLQRDHVHTRELFFLSTIGARRRLERKWQETPLAKVFTLDTEWALLKHHAQAVFICQALAQRNMTLWEAFTSFDFDDNGVLTPAEFYGAMLSLGVPNLTADDVVDMIEAADRNDDGVIDYREYLDMLKEGGAQAQEEEAEEEENEGADDVTGEDGTTRKKARALPQKIEPFGAEELRTIISARRREKVTRQRQDRVRRQAYQQALDIKVFESELKASHMRQGGANPTTTQASDGVIVTVFRFNGNDAPIRMVPSGKWKFTALRGYHSMAKKTTMTCNEGHELIIESRYWDDCVLCARRQTRFRCRECNGYNVCQRCYQRTLEEYRKKTEDVSDKITFAHIFGGCSFSLQVPAAAVGLSLSLEENDIVDTTARQVASISVGAEDDEAIVPIVAAAEEVPASPFEVKADTFTITMEVKFERLPPKGHSTALLRFYPSTHGRSRSRHLASIYLTHDGHVVSSAGLDLPPAQAGLAVVKPMQWCIVSVAVDATRGLVSCYVDGLLSYSRGGHDQESLELRHQLVVFGGGKQAQSRGGMVHRILIHNRMLDAPAIVKVAADSMLQLETHVIWYVAPGATFGNVKKEMDEAGFKVKVVTSVAEALSSIHRHTKCFVASLGEAPIDFTSLPTQPITLSGEPDKDCLDSAMVFLDMVTNVFPAMLCVADSSCMTSKIVFKNAERISCRWKAGATWYNGRITRVHDNDTYDILYDDGDVENHVSPEFIRSMTLSKLSVAQVALRERCRRVGVVCTTNDSLLRDTLFGCEMEFLKRLAVKEIPKVLLEKDNAEVTAAATGGDGDPATSAEEKQDDGKSVSITCNSGHPLTAYVTPSPSYTCDGPCHSSLPAGTFTQSCRPCNFDMCLKCFNAKREAEMVKVKKTGSKSEDSVEVSEDEDES